MTNFVITAVIYGVAGLAFAIIMFMIAGRIKSFTTPQGTALMIDLGKLGKYQTGNAFIALGMLAVAVMILVPGYYLNLYFKVMGADTGPISLIAPFRPPTSESVKVAWSRDISYNPPTPPTIVFCKTHDPQAYSLQGTTSQASIDVKVYYDADKHEPMVKIRGDEWKPVTNATLPDLHFEISDLPGKPIGPGALSSAARAGPAAAFALPDPQQITEGRMIGSALATPKP